MQQLILSMRPSCFQILTYNDEISRVRAAISLSCIDVRMQGLYGSSTSTCRLLPSAAVSSSGSTTSNAVCPSVPSSLYFCRLERRCRRPTVNFAFFRWSRCPSHRFGCFCWRYDITVRDNRYCSRPSRMCGLFGLHHRCFLRFS